MADGRKQLVTHLVTKAIVDNLEPIEVNEHDDHIAFVINVAA